MKHTRLSAGVTRAGGFRGDRADPFLVPPIRLTLGALLAINGAAVLVLGLLPGGLMAMCRDAIVKALSS